jgi:hypothetical protein
MAIDYFSAESIEATELYKKIKENVGDDSKAYSDPKIISNLPFPFVGPIPTSRFKLNDRSSFEYMGREEFCMVLDAINQMGRQTYEDILILGTIGYGKSHILAAMVCYLIKTGKRVVFLPDCRCLVNEPVKYFRQALYLTFGDQEPARRKIQDCRTLDDIKNFFKDASFDKIKLYVIVDQINALESENCNEDVLGNNAKLHVREVLNSLKNGHYIIQSSSANYRTAMHMQQKQTNEKRIRFFGGLTEVCELLCLLCSAYHFPFTK